MPRYEGLARRSRTEWVLRGLLAAGAAALGYVAVNQAWAQVAMRDDAAFAHRLAPANGRVAARLAVSLTDAEATPADRRRADTLARQALLQDATAVSAVAALAINAEVRGDHAGARRLFAYSQKLTRRDLRTQLWAIEDAVGRGDVSEALRHYDIALRTDSTAAASLLYPVLASASADPEIRRALVSTLAAKPNWSDSFIAYISGRGPDPRSTATLFQELRRSSVTVPGSADAPIVNALLGGGYIDEAWRYYASTNAGADRRASRDPRFMRDEEAPSLLDWVPVNDGTVTSSIQRGDQGGVFEFSAPASVGGPVLQQWQLLPPGTYRLEGHSIGIEQEENARPYWVLSCQHDGRELDRIPLPNSTQADGRFAGSFIVPKGCPVQVLTLVARASDAVAGISGQIDRAQLVPAK